MKCPKCGSENILYNTSYDGKDYYICGNCKTHYSLPTVAVSKTELTTAEMLLWLVKKYPMRTDPSYKLLELVILNETTEKLYCGRNTEQTIKQAYDWAKEQK